MIRNRFCFALFAPIAIGIVLSGFLLVSANAQALGITAKPLLQTTLSGDDTKESVMLSVEFAAGSKMWRHTHPGDEYTVVLQGTVELSAEGRETRRVSAGEAYHIPRGLAHETQNVGDTPARIVHVFVVDKGKPLLQPVAK
jgi:quercetin dioxygenase-like cupin family protein